jgi:hypothetical protein
MVHEEEKSNCNRLPVCFPAKNDERLFLLFDEWSRNEERIFWESGAIAHLCVAHAAERLSGHSPTRLNIEIPDPSSSSKSEGESKRFFFDDDDT